MAFKLKDVDPLVSMKIEELKEFPAWPSFMCGQNFTKLIAQVLKRGTTSRNDVATELPERYITQTTTDSLTDGDWTVQSGAWPCFIFNPENEILFRPGEVDEIILIAFVDEGVTPSGILLFGIFDEERNFSKVGPFNGPIPSINTFTFTRSQKTDVDKKKHFYFSVNKQNINKMVKGFVVKTIAARFLYSPETYSVSYLFI